jgi:uncharacterized protein (TIGR02246 family)
MIQSTPVSTSAATEAEDFAAVGSLLDALSTAWAANDAKAFADLFTADGSCVLPGDIYMRNHGEILGFMSAAYQGPYKGTGVTGTPLNIRYVDDNTTIMITEGGVLAPGETQVAPERAIRATWVCVRQDAGWKIAAYHNSPLNV